MATTNGTVKSIYVTEDWGCVNVETAPGSVSIKLLWSNFSTPTYTAEDRIRHNQWLSLARDAFSSGGTIEIVHDNGSSLATGVRIE